MKISDNESVENDFDKNVEKKKKDKKTKKIRKERQGSQPDDVSIKDMDEDQIAKELKKLENITDAQASNNDLDD
jgi:hypothetical protein